MERPRQRRAREEEGNERETGTEKGREGKRKGPGGSSARRLKAAAQTQVQALAQRPVGSHVGLLDAARRPESRPSRHHRPQPNRLLALVLRQPQTASDSLSSASHSASACRGVGGALENEGGHRLASVSTLPAFESGCTRSAHRCEYRSIHRDRRQFVQSGLWPESVSPVWPRSAVVSVTSHVGDVARDTSAVCLSRLLNLDSNRRIGLRSAHSI